jgi:hypothetical protein
MSKSVRWACGLWLLLAVVVFNVRFDWQSRLAGHAFVHAQLMRQRHGLPPISINDGFRPMVRAAARDAAAWFAVIAAFGAASTAAAARASR